MCADGSHATAVGGSDDHEGGDGSGVLYSPIGMPTTMVYAEELSVDAILEGVRSGRTVIKVNSPDDPMLETELSGERVGNTVFADAATPVGHRHRWRGYDTAGHQERCRGGIGVGHQ